MPMDDVRKVLHEWEVRAGILINPMPGWTDVPSPQERFHIELKAKGPHGVHVLRAVQAYLNEQRRVARLSSPLLISQVAGMVNAATSEAPLILDCPGGSTEALALVGELVASGATAVLVRQTV